jgi:3-hydroxyacyl-CoA dehydrogenase
MEKQEMPQVVTHALDGAIAVVTIDSPPVNTLGRDVRAGLKACFEEIQTLPAVRAIVLTCGGKTFISGGDMREFETGIQEPGYHEVLTLIESSTVPVVAALHGTVMGAGVETALACHYRICDAATRLGLPEISLGIIPGAGGTQRMPRLIGLEPALDMMLDGKPRTAAQARTLGLVDTVVDDDVRSAALAYAKDLVASGKGPRRTRDLTIAGGETGIKIITSRRAEVAKTLKNRNSPNVLLDAVQAAVDLPFELGLARERELSDQVERAVEGRAFRHIFFGERELRRIPGLPSDTRPRNVAKVGVIGAGTMGGGISMCFANAGIPVTIVDSAQANLDRGLATIRKNYERSVTRGRLKPEQAEQRMALITPTLDYAALGDADMIIEAVFESMALKKEIFAKLDSVAKPGAILGTNTSTLDIDEIAAVTHRPQDVIGLHFFSPANVMQLLEIVQCAKTAPEVVITALDIARTIRKVGVVAKVCYGFIGNRMMDPYGREAERCLLEGATPTEVDSALEDFGMAMGILAVYDMAGVDIGHLTRIERAHLLPDDPSFYRPSALLVERGWLGQKSGRGYYRYDNPERRRTPDPEVIAMIREEADRLGVPQRRPSAQEIRERCLYAMINEGARILEEGVACRASDIDIVYTSGYGFPRYRGGPMFYADTIGLKNIHNKLLEFSATLDPQYWQPAPLLERLALAGSTFAQWQSEHSHKA